MKKLPGCCLLLLLLSTVLKAQNTPIHLLYTSDAHYGIFRAKFRGDTAVAGYQVNAAMIAQMNHLPGQRLPDDKGVAAGQPISAIDYLVQTGDIANRMEPPYQTATKSWQQFEYDYRHHLHLKGNDGKATTLLLAPGNHDTSNAIGYPKKMVPATDPTPMVQMYNQMLQPATPLTNATFDYKKDKINYSRNIGGVHFMFITLWPDSAERIWMAHDLQTVPAQTPVIIFTHDQPTCEAKHFNNPAAPGTFPAGSKFEDLTEEIYKDGAQARKDDAATDVEQRGWVRFLKQHPNIKAYFHGNSNWNEFYTYHGPDNDVDLPVFRVDSPMKGSVSAKDETKLSFQLISLDSQQQLLTVRECLWNTQPGNPAQQVVFGQTKTISLKVR